MVSNSKIKSQYFSKKLREGDISKKKEMDVIRKKRDKNPCSCIKPKGAMNDLYYQYVVEKKLLYSDLCSAARAITVLLGKLIIAPGGTTISEEYKVFAEL